MDKDKFEQKADEVIRLYLRHGLRTPARWSIAESPRELFHGMQNLMPSMDSIRRMQESNLSREVSSMDDRHRLMNVYKASEMFIEARKPLSIIARRAFIDHNKISPRYSSKRDFGIIETQLNHCVGISVNAVTLCEDPTILKTDSLGRLHSLSGPAIRYGDRLSCCYIQGVEVPDQWIRGRLPSATQALQWRNTEQRRILCQELIGWDRIAHELKSDVLDTDLDPEIGQLVRCRTNMFQDLTILRVRCGTGRSMGLVVPNTMKTAREANAWTWGLKEEDYEPEVRT